MIFELHNLVSPHPLGLFVTVPLRGLFWWLKDLTLITGLAYQRSYTNPWIRTGVPTAWGGVNTAGVYTVGEVLIQVLIQVLILYSTKGVDTLSTHACGATSAFEQIFYQFWGELTRFYTNFEEVLSWFGAFFRSNWGVNTPFQVLTQPVLTLGQSLVLIRINTWQNQVLIQV